MPKITLKKISYLNNNSNKLAPPREDLNSSAKICKNHTMTQVFTIDDNGRFGRILLFVILLHLILLMGTYVFPNIAPAFKQKMTSLLEAISSSHMNQRVPKIAINIASQHNDSLILHQADLTSLNSSHDHLTLNQPLRRKVISAASYAAKDAAYLAKWQAYVEKYGNTHYPKAILNSNLQGNLRLLVAINQDGSLREVTVRQSSGSPILDQAAIDIVLNAAPFEPLPPDIADDTDILEIIRTWQFRGTLSTLSQ